MKRSELRQLAKSDEQVWKWKLCEIFKVASFDYVALQGLEIEEDHESLAKLVPSLQRFKRSLSRIGGFNHIAGKRALFFDIFWPRYHQDLEAQRNRFRRYI